MAKFLPVVGEVITAVESAGKLVAAGVTAPFDPKAGKKLVDSAGQAWVDYKDQNLLACTCRGDGKGIVQGVDAFSQSCPGVAHVRGVVHLARGENQEAYDCIANGTKAIGVCAAAVVATTATGGMGTAAALACVGGSAAATQVALDGVDTGIRSGYNGEFRAAGTIQGVQRAVKTGDAVHIAEAVIAPAQTAAVAAGGAAVARAVASANMASEQNLSGTGQSLTKPPAQANPALTPENLAAVSQQAPRPSPLVPPEGSVGGSGVSVPNSMAGWPNSAASTTSLESQVSLVSEAYSAPMQAQLISENPVKMLNSRGQPSDAARHAFDRHIHQMNAPEALDLVGNWNLARGMRFVNWLQEQIASEGSVMYDVLYRGEPMRAIFNPRNNVAVFVRVNTNGAMDLVAAFPLSPAQQRYLLAQNPRVN
ncbi:unnamed protein product [Symbiodinium sp. CCMP2592]|nr:unnamed protein product [Symbiodinium sp. CCMP2592]